MLSQSQQNQITELLNNRQFEIVKKLSDVVANHDFNRIVLEMEDIDNDERCFNGLAQRYDFIKAIQSNATSKFSEKISRKVVEAISSLKN